MSALIDLVVLPLIALAANGDAPPPLEATEDADAAQPAESPADSGFPGSIGYEDGFFLRSESGSSELVFGGLFQFQGRIQPRRDVWNEFSLKRARPEIYGTFDDIYHFRIQTDFNENGSRLEEAWGGIDVGSEGQRRLIIGRKRAPFGLEEAQSRRWIAFNENSILNQFSPREQHGVFYYHESDDVSYGIGLYNGTGGDEVDKGKELGARLTTSLADADVDGELDVGGSFTIGNEDRSVAGAQIFNESGLPFATLQAGARNDGIQWRAGLEALYLNGSTMLMAEYQHHRTEMEGVGGKADIDTSGFHVTAQQALTGEEMTFNGVKPKNPYLPSDDTANGAWVAAARLSWLDLDSSLADTGIIAGPSYTSNVLSLSAGMNWVLTNHMMVRNSFIYSHYAGKVLIDGDQESGESALVIEFQVQF